MNPHTLKFYVVRFKKGGFEFMNHEVVTLEPSNLSVIWSKGIYIFLGKELNQVKHASNVLFWLRLDSTHYLLCSPEFVPQITGGALFPGAVTLKISV